MIGIQGDDDQYKHYDVHSLYGYSETEPTQRFSNLTFIQSMNVLIIIQIVPYNH
jgi:hypothetical protein